MMVRVKKERLEAAMASWCGEADNMGLCRHFMPHDTHEDILDGTIVDTVLCIETGKVVPAPPHLPLNLFEGWVASNFQGACEVNQKNTLS